MTDFINLVAEIHREHTETSRCIASGLKHARRAGELLQEAKAELPHGEWLPWLAEHCPTIPERTAQAYMRVAQHWLTLEAKAPRVADLPMRQALALLAEPRPPLLNIPSRYDGEIDWPARAVAMEAAWEDLGVELDELRGRIGRAADLEEAADNLHRAEELEGRALALHASTICDFRHVMKDLAALIQIPVPRLRPLTEPEGCEAFLAACRERIAELEAVV